MSLILEALRKSEAERRRGQVPDLHAAPSPGAQPLREGPPAGLWLALALAAAVVLVVVLWLARDTAPEPSPAVGVPVTETAVTRARSTDPDRAAGPGDDPATPFASPATAEGQAVADALPESPDPPGREPDAAQMPVAGSAASASTPAGREPDTTGIPGPVATRATRAPVTPPASPPPPAVTTAPARPPAPAPVASPSAAGTADAAPDAVPRSAPLRLSDLSVAQRQQLPPLKVSMHMYSATQRFAIIDGARVAQGDRIGDAVVEDITANGVVLDWQGLRLQIPIR